MDRFSKLASHALERSLSVAEELGHSYLGSEHLLYGLLKEHESIAARLLLSKGITADRVHKQIRDRLGYGAPTLLSAGDMTPRLEQILARGGALARRHDSPVVGTDHLLAALCESPESIGFRLLEELGCLPKKLAADLKERMGIREIPLQTEKSKPRTAKNSPVFFRDLTREAALDRLPPLIGRERELEQLMSVLLRQNKSNPCLVGEPGVGKTVLVEGLAQRIAAGQVPPPLLSLQLRMPDLASMIAGTKYRGEFEERFRSMLSEAERDPSVVLFIDELHVLIGAGAAEGALDAANILKPALARGKIRLIGATTPEEYRRYIERDGALERRFAPIRLEEPSPAETLRILQGLRPSLEEHHRLQFPEETLQAAIDLAARYVGDRFFPDKAVDLLDEAGGRKQLTLYRAHGKEHRDAIEKKQKELDRLLQERQFVRALELREELEQHRVLADPPPHTAVLTPKDLTALVAEKTGIPLAPEDPGGQDRYRGLEQRLLPRLIGQQEAIHSLCTALMRSKAGVSDPCRPACVLLFCGPTGVGKTRLARLLAKELLDSEDALLKYDMGEYTEPHTVARLIGAPPGYVGHEQGGGLVSRVRDRPYSILLFDEIEKAHPDVMNVLLGLLDEGRLTDGLGKTADFRNTIILMTSNLGSAEREEPLGFGEGVSEPASTVRRAVGRRFRPEFVNRLDEIVLFRPLELSALEEIAALHLRELEQRLERQGHRVRFTDALAKEAALRGRDRRYGARAVRRFIEKEIGTRVACGLLEGSLPSEVGADLLPDSAKIH